MTAPKALTEPLLVFDDQEPARLSELSATHPLVLAIAAIATGAVLDDANSIANQNLQAVAQQIAQALIAAQQAAVQSVAAALLPLTNGSSPDAGDLTGEEDVPISRGNGLIQTTLSNFAQYAQTAFSWVETASSGELSRTTQARFLDLLSIKKYCVADGVADDTAGAVLAEAEAYTTGKILFFPSGSVLNYNGQFSCRVGIWGVGATLKQTQTAVSTNPSVSTLNLSGITGQHIEGLTIDSNLKCSGLIFNGCTDCHTYNVRVLNSANLAFGAYLSSGIQHHSGYAKKVIYSFSTIPSPGGAADGYYFGGCTRSRAINCYVEDFQRIGFVSEGNGSTKSVDNVFQLCTAKYAHDCDDSTTEYNAGFWIEDTNSGAMLDCFAENISSGVGQTSGRVVGAALGGGQTATGQILLKGVRVYGNTATIPQNFLLNTDGGYTTVIVRDVYGENGNIGITSRGGMFVLYIDNPTFRKMVYAASNHGGIVINGGGYSLPVLDIARYNTLVSENTYAPNSADINIYNSPAGCSYFLHDCNNGYLTHITRQTIAEHKVSNCNITYGSSTTTYGSFQGTQNSFSQCNLALASGGNGFLVCLAGLSGAFWGMQGCTLTSSVLTQTELSGSNNTLQWNGCHFNGVTFKSSITGTYSISLNQCSWDTIDTNGAFKFGLTNPVYGEFYVNACRVNTPNAAYVPFQKWNFNPTVGFIDARSNATQLHNFTANVNAVSGMAYQSPAAVAITGGTISGATISGGTVSAATLTNPVITGGSINSAAIGATTPALVIGSYFRATARYNAPGSGAPAILELDNSGTPSVGRLLTGDGTGYGFRIGKRSSAGVVTDYVSVNDQTGVTSFSSAIGLASFTVATLPTTATPGQVAYASNGRKSGEAAAAGTGVPVYYSNSAWRVQSTDAAVQA